MIDAVLGALSEKNKRLAVSGVIALMTFFIVSAGVVQPAMRKIKSIEIQQNELKEKEPLLRSVLDTEGKLAAYVAKMSPDRDLAPLQSKLAELAEKSALQNVSITLEKVPVDSGEGAVEKLSISVDATGTFRQLGEFISGIENLEAFTKISRIDFGRMSVGSDKPLKPGAKRISILVSTFFAAKELAA